MNKKREPYLGNPQETIAVLNKYQFTFQKKLGQNFIDRYACIGKNYFSGRHYRGRLCFRDRTIGTMTQYLASAARKSAQWKLIKA